MTTTPPSGFINLYDAVGRVNREAYNVMGVCVDYLQPAKSKGSDYTITFTLYDHSWSEGRGMKFRFFCPSINDLPKIQSKGDVVVIRDITTRAIQNQPIGLAGYSTKWTVLSGSSIMDSTYEDGSDIKFVAGGSGLKRTSSPTLDELKYVKLLVSVTDSHALEPPPKSTILDVETRMKEAGGTVPQRKDKWRLIQDLKPQSQSGETGFADLFGEVRKSWLSDYGRVELSLTDYTTNKLLYEFSQEAQSRDGDTYGYTDAVHEKWPGPWGRMTISILLFDAHADYARSEVREGMFVLVKNCQIKLDPNGSRLEAVCRGDRDDPTRVNVIVRNPHRAQGDEKFAALLKRRHEYDKYARANGIRFGFDGTAHKQRTKRSPHDLEGISEVKENNPNIDESTAKLSKRARKRAKKPQQTNTSKGNIEDPENPARSTDSGSNQNVRCLKVEVPVKSIETILNPDILKRKTPKGKDFDLPFQNCSYKIRVRVVDYFPHEIADFSVPCLVTDYDAPSDGDELHDSSLTLNAAQENSRSVRWEWRFFLVVEDAGNHTSVPDSKKSQMMLLVAGPDGDHLINQEASDLRARPQDKARLTEKLFHLWGDLQENKDAVKAGETISDLKPRSRPFECLIKEYGVVLPQVGKADGTSVYQRIFRLFGTASV